MTWAVSWAVSWAGSGSASVATPVAGVAAALAVLLVLGGAGAASPDGSDRRYGVRRRPASELDLVDVIERIAREVRAGDGLRRTLEAALDASPSLLPAVREALRAQEPLADALARHCAADDERDVVVHALRLAAAHPQVAGRVLDRAVAVVRERRTWRQERVVQSAQARTSARVLTLLPLGFALWGVTTSTSVRSAYTTSSVAAASAVVGALLNLAGWWWMRRIVGGRP